jgi:hypothetical protein
VKTTILEDALDADFYIHKLGLEAQQLEAIFGEHTRRNRVYGIMPALESEEEGEKEELTPARKSVLAKVWDFIIRVLTALYSAVVKFFTGMDIAMEKKHAKRAEEILRNKERHNVQFARDIVKQLPESVLVVISAIENDKNFVPLYNKGVELERKIDIPPRHMSIVQTMTLNANAKALDTNIEQLNGFIAAAQKKDPSARDYALLETLASGFSIDGSENAAYLKAFESAGPEKKYQKMTKAAEDLKSSYGAEEVVEAMRRVAGVLSKQFALEAKVVTAYTKLAKAVIAVNDKIQGKE